MLSKEEKKPVASLAWGLLGTVLTFIILLNYLVPSYFGKNQYSYLADAFIHGRLYFLEPLVDRSIYDGKYYWPLGVFPAFLLVPMVAVFGVQAPVWIIQSVGILLCSFLTVKIAQKEGYSQTDSQYWALALVGGSMFLGQAALFSSWYFAQIVAVTFLLFAIYESLSSKRWWVIGCCISVLLMTRPVSAGALLFFIWCSQVDNNEQYRLQLKALLQLLIPVAVTALFLCWYNYARFDNPFEQGYKYQILPPAVEKATSYGIFSSVHIPGNLYYMFLAPPRIVLKDGLSKVLSFPFIKSNVAGMGIFVTSPWLIYLWFVRYKQRYQAVLIATILIMVFPILCYYGIGEVQFGYRYALDFLPLLLLLLMRSWRRTEKRLSRSFRFLIAFSAAMNIYLFLWGL